MIIKCKELEGRSWIYRLINNICCIFLIVQICVISIVVFGRFVLNETPGWGEELSLFCMIYFSLLSVSLAIDDSRHIKMTLAEKYMPKKFNEFVRIFNYFIIFCIGSFMTIVGTDLTIFTRKGTTPGLHISNAYMYAAVPISGVAILVILIKKIYKKEVI